MGIIGSFVKIFELQIFIILNFKIVKKSKNATKNYEFQTQCRNILFNTKSPAKAIKWIKKVQDTSNPSLTFKRWEKCPKDSFTAINSSQLLHIAWMMAAKNLKRGKEVKLCSNHGGKHLSWAGGKGWIEKWKNYGIYSTFNHTWR